MSEESNAWQMRHKLQRNRDSIDELTRIQLEKQIVETALREKQDGDLYIALDYSRKLGDRAKVREIAELCLESNHLYDAMRAFEFLGSKKGLNRVLQANELIQDSPNPKRSEDIIEDLVFPIFGRKLIKKTNSKFGLWLKSEGFPAVNARDPFTTITMAHTLVPKYDFGVGIANSGLYSAYMFNLFGLPVGAVDYHVKHREGQKDTPFKWLTEPKREELEGKRILVFDKDILSGRTSRRVAEELMKYNPLELSLVLNNDSTNKNERKVTQITSTYVENAPKEYKNIYYPSKFDYRNFSEIVKVFRKIMKEKYG